MDADPELSTHAVSLYGSADDTMDEFPVLKAFQQYIDAEQAKSRKRLVIVSAFFVLVMFAMIAIFIVLLIGVNERNQALNDRLNDRNQALNDRMIEFALKERERQTPPAVQPQQDSAAVLAMNSMMDEMRKQMAASEKRARQASEEAAEAQEKAAEAVRKATAEAREARAAAVAAQPKTPSPEELEIKRLNALLAAEKEKQLKEAVREREKKEKERRREEELEAYRRQHYPELYAPRQPVAVPAAPARPLPAEAENAETDEIDKLLDAVKTLKKTAARPKPSTLSPKPERKNKKTTAPVDLDRDGGRSYFDEEPAPSPLPAPVATNAAPVVTVKPAPVAAVTETNVAATVRTACVENVAAVSTNEQKKTEVPFRIPVEIRGKKSTWLVPEN